MVDLDGNSAVAADLDRLVYGLEQVIGLGADVRDVNAAIGCHHFRQLDQVALADEIVGRVDQGRGQAEGAVFHRRANEPAHRLQLSVRWRALVHPFDVGPNGRRSHERAEVDRRAVALHRPQPGVEAMRARELAGTFGGVGLVGLDKGDRAIVGGSVGPAFAHDFGRDALSNLADDPAVAGEQGFAGVALNVDETRADDQPCRVDPLFRRRVFQNSRRCDPRDPAALQWQHRRETTHCRCRRSPGRPG